MTDQTVDFAEVFGRLIEDSRTEETVQLGGIAVRLVRVEGGGEGRWDRHDGTAETVVVWSGEFSVEFRNQTLQLARGQCCVVPVGIEHRGASATGAEIILFQQA